MSEVGYACGMPDKDDTALAKTSSLLERFSNSPVVSMKTGDLKLIHSGVYFSQEGKGVTIDLSFDQSIIIFVFNIRETDSEGAKLNFDFNKEDNFVNLIEFTLDNPKQVGGKYSIIPPTPFLGNGDFQLHVGIGITASAVWNALKLEINLFVEESSDDEK